MGLFHRKKTETKSIDPMEEVLDCLHKSVEHSEIHDGCLWLPKEQLTIKPGIGKVEDRFAALYFEVLHSTFEQPFFDMSAGTGNTTADAIHKGVAGFLFSSFCGIRHCIEKEYVQELTSTFCGVEKHWNVSESCIAHLCGSNDKTHPPIGGYWNLIAEMLPAHLGNRKYYWVKIYTSKQQSGEVICECRINNIVSAELTQKVAEFAETWDICSVLVSDKQFFVLTQQEDTITPYPYTREQIFQFTDKAIDIFAAANTDEQHEQLADTITKMTGDVSLGAELYSFLPEICAQDAFSQVTYGEQIVLCRGDQKYEFYIDQIASYRWIQERARDGFSSGRYTQETFKQLVYSSATCNVLSKALNNGSELSDMVLTSLAFMVPDDYVIR